MAEGYHVRSAGKVKPSSLFATLGPRYNPRRLQLERHMTVKVGDKVPSATLMEMQEGGPKPVKTDDLFAGKKVVLFALPGAFTPTCSAKHVPGFVQNAQALKAKGIDEIACVSVNDAFVMGAWGKDQKSDGKVRMLADGNGDFTRAMGLELDGSRFGMGKRSQRYAMIVDNGVIKELNVEEAGAFSVSSAEHVLTQL
jgi:peroxiredoxin